MTLPIYLYGHPLLRKISKEISPEYPGLKQLVGEMFETMYSSDGVGLAAPQVGRNDRIVVIDADPLKDTYPECAGRKFTLINPEIEIIGRDSVSRFEGCLSLPNLSEAVNRVEHIRLKWLDEDFVEHREEISGFLARIIQHECDHLDGHLYIDHISPIRKQLIKGKLNNIANGKVSCDYPLRYAPRKRR